MRVATGRLVHTSCEAITCRFRFRRRSNSALKGRPSPKEPAESHERRENSVSANVRPRIHESRVRSLERSQPQVLSQEKGLLLGGSVTAGERMVVTPVSTSEKNANTGDAVTDVRPAGRT